MTKNFLNNANLIIIILMFSAFGCSGNGNEERGDTPVISKVKKASETVVPPKVTLQLNSNCYNSNGQELLLNIQTAIGSMTDPVDAYIALKLTDESLLFLKLDKSFTSEQTPIIANWNVINYSGTIFNYTITGTEPEGNHTFYAAFAEPGTMNFISPLASAPFRVTKGSCMPDYEIPPDPISIASEVDKSFSYDFKDVIEFLFTSNPPVQSDVANEAIDAKRASVLKGKILDNQGNPLLGVKVSILNHPEYGYTVSRNDGLYDIALNGGNTYNLVFEKRDYLQVQRKVDVRTNDYQWVKPVVLLKYDLNNTVKINLSSLDDIAVAKGNIVTDSDGTRQVTALFAPLTEVVVEYENGNSEILNEIEFTATEYTIGDFGPDAMPGSLPPATGYTYAVALNLKKALINNAKIVSFSKPVVTYVDNFLGFKIGSIVPCGYFDRELGEWVACDDGVIIKILSENSGMANIDVDGDNIADSGSKLNLLGIDDLELKKLAELYNPLKSLWRVRVNHFSDYDYNMAKANDGADSPSMENASKSGNDPDSDLECGSVIECHNQTLGESVSVTGTDFYLHYKSTRMSGYKAKRALNIKLTGSDYPNKLNKVHLEVEVMGQKTVKSFSPAKNLIYKFIWDGKDAYSRPLTGNHPVTIMIGYEYPSKYIEITGGGAGQSFGSNPGENGENFIISQVDSRDSTILWQKFNDNITVWEAKNIGLGGFSINVHHVYDPKSKELYLGNGDLRVVKAVGKVMDTLAGNGDRDYDENNENGLSVNAAIGDPGSVAVSHDGTVYVADRINERVYKIDPIDETISTFAGGGYAGYYGEQIPEGTLATDAYLSYPYGLAIGRDNSLYIADTGSNRIFQIDKDSIITVVAGTGEEGYSGDGAAAIEADLRSPSDVAIGVDGSVYIADTSNNVIRRVSIDGIITTVAGTGYTGYNGNKINARSAKLNNPLGIATDFYGNLYISDSNNNLIRKVSVNGMITTIAGYCDSICEWGYNGDNRLASEAQLFNPMGIDVDDNGNIFFIDEGNARVRKIDARGIITTLAGNGETGFKGDGGNPFNAMLNNPYDVAMGSFGNTHIADYYNARIRRIGSPVASGDNIDELKIPSENGRLLYIFNNEGMHLRTLNAFSQDVIYEFEYVNENLKRIKDAYNNMTEIEHFGSNIIITGPFGQSTTLGLNSYGYVDSIANPLNEKYQFTYYDEQGLLKIMTDPMQNQYSFEYDEYGMLAMDKNPANGYKGLSRTEKNNGYRVDVYTAMNRVTGYDVENMDDYNIKKIKTHPSGLKTESLIYDNNVLIKRQTTYPDKTIINEEKSMDPRWNMEAPVTSLYKITSPLGLELKFEKTVEAQLSNSDNPFSFNQFANRLVINNKTYIEMYDKSAKKWTITTPEGKTSSTEINNFGKISKISADGLYPFRYEYNSNGQIDSISTGHGADERVYNFSYYSSGHQKGNLSKITDPLNRVTQFEYDGAGRITGKMFPDGKQAFVEYDANGNVKSFTPPGKLSHVFNYTAVNQTSEYTPPEAGFTNRTTLYEYDLDQQLKRIIKPNSQTVDFIYDNAARIERITHDDGETTYHYYSETGNPEYIETSDGQLLYFDYDGFLPTKKLWLQEVAGQVTYGYNNDFHLKYITINNLNPIFYEYDNDNNITKAGDLTIGYNSISGLPEESEIEKVFTYMSFNSFAEQTEFEATYNGNSIYKVDYTTDKLGRIITKTENTGEAINFYIYSYDLFGRLEYVYKDGELKSHYRYESNGNRLSKDPDSDLQIAFYDNQDRLLSYEDMQFAYTENGDLKAKTKNGQTTEYYYDSFGNLKRVGLADGTEIEYVIDGKNRRVGKKVNGILAKGFIYKDQLNPVAELDGSNNVVSQFIYGNKANTPEYMIKNGEAYYIASDYLGSPRVVVNVNTGAIAQQIEYDEFGKIASDTNPGFQPFGFAGGIYDANTELTRFGARDYYAETGRWTAKDPILFSGGNANLYGYALGDPVNLVDPEGLKDEKGGIVEKAKTAKKGYDIIKKIKDWFDFGKDIKDAKDAINDYSEYCDNALKTPGEFNPNKELQTIKNQVWGCGKKRHGTANKLLEPAKKIKGVGPNLF